MHEKEEEEKVLSHGSMMCACVACLMYSHVVTDLSWLQPNNYSCMILSHVIVLFCISHSPSQSHVTCSVSSVQSTCSVVCQF